MTLASDQTPPQLLPGPSAEELTKPFLRNSIGALAGGAAMVMASISPPALTGPLAFGGLAMIFVFGWRAWLANDRLGEALRREEAAGYTTVSGSSHNLWRLDSRTGAVIRRPQSAKSRRSPPQ